MTAQAIISWASQTGIAVTLLICLVLLIRRPFARLFGAGATYALWVLPVARLLMPEITIPAFQKTVPNFFNDITFVQPPAAMIDNGSATAELSPTLNLWPWIVGIWLAVAIIWFVFQILRQSAFMSRLRLETTPAPDALLPIITTAMETLELKKRPDIRLSPKAIGPMVTGAGRSIVILPHNFCEAYTRQQQEFALVHELAHIKRHDLWAALLVLGFRAINWPNPLVHFAAHKFREDQEAACDAYVLSKVAGGDAAAQSYAETLVHAAKSTHASKSHAPLGLALVPQSQETDND